MWRLFGIDRRIASASAFSLPFFQTTAAFATTGLLLKKKKKKNKWKKTLEKALDAAELAEEVPAAPAPPVVIPPVQPVIPSSSDVPFSILPTTHADRESTAEAAVPTSGESREVGEKEDCPRCTKLRHLCEVLKNTDRAMWSAGVYFRQRAQVMMTTAEAIREEFKDLLDMLPVSGDGSGEGPSPVAVAREGTKELLDRFNNFHMPLHHREVWKLLTRKVKSKVDIKATAKKRKKLNKKRRKKIAKAKGIVTADNDDNEMQELIDML